MRGDSRVIPVQGPAGGVGPESRDAAGWRASLPVESPAIDIYDEGEALILEADMPGVSAEELSLQIEDSFLTLRGLASGEWPEAARPIRLEYGPRDLARSFILSAEIDRGGISAELKDGVLQVRLPKAAASPPRKIEVRSSDS